MMEFVDLIAAKDLAVEAYELSQRALADASESLVAAQERSEATAKARIEAHQAIHDVLAERGMHHTIDEKGTVTIYSAIDDEPGWRVDHPLPGTTKAAATKAVK